MPSIRVFRSRSVTVQRSLKCQIDKGEVRTETLAGREYTVIPVVAMVEGVRFGANQSEAELGLASEFGENPILWANRPLVLNHPKVDGVFVSANSPSILEEYQFGMTMNPELDDTKLRMEAWIDVVRVEELGGEFKELYDIIVDQESEEIVEVSVGFFSDVEQKKGKFKGQSYGGIWRNVRPDHLAILSLGTIGACSVKDGCGVPRINSQDKDGEMPKALKADSASGCSCGGHTTQSEHDEQTDVTVNETDDQIEVVLKRKPKTSVPSVQRENTDEPLAFEAQEAEKRQDIRELNRALLTQQLPEDMLDRDISKILSRALIKKYGSYTYCYGFTTQDAYFETYDYNNGGYKLQKIGVNISNDGAVEFVGEPSEVILLTKVVPQDPNAPVVQTEENDMPDGAKTTTTPTTTQTTEANATTPTTQESGAGAGTQPQAQAKQMTVQEYVDQAPAEIRDMLQAGLRAQQERRNGAIAAIKANQSNKFTDEKLQAMSLEDLESLVALAAPNYAGLAPAAAPRIVDQKAGETVPVVRAFERKTAATPSQAA